MPNATDLWQPVDAGFGEFLEVLTKQEHNPWLDCDKNADRWYGNTEPLSAKEQRILITHWVGNAYNKLISQDYKPYVWRIWEKAGGSEDEKIQPEGLKEYKVQPPMPMEPAQVHPVSNSVDPMDEENEANLIEDEVQQEEGDMLEDNIQDRDFTNALIGKKVEALYENGWFIGDIKYFNTVLKEYKVTYPDKTSDYLTIDDFDDIPVIPLVTYFEEI